MNAIVRTEMASESGTEIFVPLNKLKKSPRNARKTPHSAATIEALAASIDAKGMLQNLVVEPELDESGAATGFYFVTVGEGRRLAQLLRAKRKQIKKTEPIRCVLDTHNDPHEISLDENVTREAMHPADQFEAFRRLHEERGWGAEEIAARFGVTPHVVRQRLRLGAVSPRLMQAYREGGLTLDQLMAFAITDDHDRQEQVYENLSYNRVSWIIRRELTRTNVPASDRRAVFIGPEAYTEAGGVIIRDLFSEDRGGYFEDAALLDRLVIEKLQRIADDVRESEGWKWADVHIDYPHAHGLRRTYPKPVDLSPEDEAACMAAREEYDRLAAEWDGADALPQDVEERLREIEAKIKRLDARRYAFGADEIARGGVYVVLSYEGAPRIERGFIRLEDEPPAAAGGEDCDDADGAASEGEATGTDLDTDSEDEAELEEKPLSDLLVRDLTAHRTLGLRLALGQQPDVALVAVTHALAAQTFYHGAEAHCLEIRPNSAPLAGHADGIADMAAAKALADRHAGWAADMPRDVAGLWDFIGSLDQTSVLALFAHCAALTVNAVKLPWERKPQARETADKLAARLRLDMSEHWAATVRSYFGRVTKAHILAAVREAVSDEAAERLAGLKKQPMAEAAETLLAGTGWLPHLLRTPDLNQVEVEATAETEDPDPALCGEDNMPAEGEAFNVAAE